ncbi:MAG: PAS domain S-box protein [Bradyrhizobium sp.]|nr:MAG: PAS domain S-box protein [Bradyrhizobium sp.]
MTDAAPDAALEAVIEARVHAELQRRLQITPALFHSIDEKGRLVAVSDAWLAKFGYTREEVIGRLSSEFLTEASREFAVSKVLPEFFRTGRCENVAYQMVRRDGEILDVLLSAMLYRGPSSHGCLSFAVITDVTALSQTKRRLAESEQLYRCVVEDQSELVSLASADGELRFVNRAYADFYGLAPEAMIGRNLFDFVPEDQRESLKAHFGRVCAAKSVIEDENQVISPTGEKRWLAWTNRALVDADGQVTAIHSVGRDVENRVRAEQLLNESEARYRFLAENSTDVIMLLDTSGKRFYVSPSCKALTGFTPEEMLASRTQDSVHPDDLERGLTALANPQGEVTICYRMRRKAGGYVWVEAVCKPVVIEGQGERRLAVLRNIDERVAAEQRLLESEAKYRLLADNSNDMVVQLDRDLVRRYASPACREILGYEPEEMIGVRPVDMAHPEDAPQLELALQSLLNGEVDRHSSVNRLRHSNGSWIWVEATLRAIRDAATSTVTGITGALRDISIRKAVEDELEQANRRLQTLAGEDALTGLANRRAFDEAIAREFRRARREKSAVGLIMIDVDRFKRFNDRYGHLAGDDCLRRIGGAIAGVLKRPGDMAARYGGEEFVVLLPNTDKQGAAKVADRIRQCVADLCIPHKDNERGYVTISAGASVTPPGADITPDTQIAIADGALYRAKGLGRNTVVVGLETHTSHQRRPADAA